MDANTINGSTLVMEFGTARRTDRLESIGRAARIRAVLSNRSDLTLPDSELPLLQRGKCLNYGVQVGEVRHQRVRFARDQLLFAIKAAGVDGK